jgi:hypothetical protein
MLELTRLGGKENQGPVTVLFATSFEHGNKCTTSNFKHVYSTCTLTNLN